MRLAVPHERHLAPLVTLSMSLAGEDRRMGSIPVGAIHRVELAQRRLLGPNVVVARVAEDEDGGQTVHILTRVS
jgi:hypothetical protein